MTDSNTTTFLANHKAVPQTNCAESMATLAQLPKEIIESCLSHLVLSSSWCGEALKNDILSVTTLHYACLVSRRLGAIATPLLYNTVLVRRDHDCATTLLRTVRECPALAQHIRHLRICDTTLDTGLPWLRKALKALPSLRSVALQWVNSIGNGARAAQLALAPRQRGQPLQALELYVDVTSTEPQGYHETGSAFGWQEHGPRREWMRFCTEKLSNFSISYDVATTGYAGGYATLSVRQSDGS